MSPLTTLSKPLILQLIIIHLLITMSLLSQHHTHLVGADERLIEIECHNAQVPAVCVKCLHSDLASQNADQTNIIIGCLSNEANALASNMSALASQVDPNGQSLLINCSKGYSMAKRSKLCKASQGLYYVKFLAAERGVSEALQYQILCQYIHKDESEKQENPILPTSIEYHMRLYDQLSEAAARIIERL